MALNLEKLSVLVVEDVMPMRNLIKSVLETLDIKKIITESHGETGLKTFFKENTDIILADWEMEEMTGLDFVHEIRTNPLSPNRYVPIIMITGYNGKKRVSEARDTGVTEYLIKPFKAKDLADRIMHVIARPRDFIEAEQYTGPDRRRSKKDHYQGIKRRFEDKEKR